MTKLKLSNLGLGVKLGFIVSAAIAGLLIATALSLYALYQEKLEARAVKVKHLTETAVTLIGHYEAVARSGQMSREDAQKAAVAA